MPRRSHGQSSTSRQKVGGKVNEERILELRIRGLSHTKIAAKLDLDQSTVTRALQRAMTRMIESTREKAEQVRDLEATRLDQMLDGVWEGATHGDVQAIDAVVKLMNRRAKLYGLDAPARQEVTGADGGPIAIDDARALLAAKLAALPVGADTGTAEGTPGEPPATGSSGAGE